MKEKGEEKDVLSNHSGLRATPISLSKRKKKLISEKASRCQRELLYSAKPYTVKNLLISHARNPSSILISPPYYSPPSPPLGFSKGKIYPINLNWRRKDQAKVGRKLGNGYIKRH